MATAIPGLYEIHMFPPQIQFQTWSINWNFKFNFKSMSSAAESSYNVTLLALSLWHLKSIHLILGVRNEIVSVLLFP